MNKNNILIPLIAFVLSGSWFYYEWFYHNNIGQKLSLVVTRDLSKFWDEQHKSKMKYIQYLSDKIRYRAQCSIPEASYQNGANELNRSYLRIVNDIFYFKRRSTIIDTTQSIVKFKDLLFRDKLQNEIDQARMTILQFVENKPLRDSLSIILTPFRLSFSNEISISKQELDLQMKLVDEAIFYWVIQVLHRILKYSDDRSNANNEYLRIVLKPESNIVHLGNDYEFSFDYFKVAKFYEGDSIFINHNRIGYAKDNEAKYVLKPNRLGQYSDTIHISNDKRIGGYDSKIISYTVQSCD